MGYDFGLIFSERLLNTQPKTVNFTRQLFSPLVGEFLIATATSKGRELSEAEITAMQEVGRDTAAGFGLCFGLWVVTPYDKLYIKNPHPTVHPTNQPTTDQHPPPKVRIAKLVVSLSKRLAPFLSGEEDAFVEVQSINAQQVRGSWSRLDPNSIGSRGLEATTTKPTPTLNTTNQHPTDTQPTPNPTNQTARQLAAASFGEVLLQAIGGVYQNEAATFLGGSNPFSVGLQRLRRTGASLKSQLQAAQAAIQLAQHQVGLWSWFWLVWPYPHCKCILYEHVASSSSRHKLIKHRRPASTPPTRP